MKAKYVTLIITVLVSGAALALYGIDEVLGVALTIPASMSAVLTAFVWRFGSKILSDQLPFSYALLVGGLATVLVFAYMITAVKVP